MFQKRIKELRMQAGLSQKALAEKLFISQQSVGKWESGISKPSPETLPKLASLFNVTTDYLLGIADEPNQNMVVVFSDGDPQINSLLAKARKLNIQGLAKLDSFADDLVASGKYEKLSATDKAM